MFANPVRPRTMTKEWQEATEEYMKVRRLDAISALSLCPHRTALISIPTATRNGAHHFQAGHDGSEQVREASARPGEAQRRVRVRLYDCVIQTLPTSIPLFLGSIFHLVLFVCYKSDQEGCEFRPQESLLGNYCVISPPVYRILEAFSVSFVFTCIVHIILACSGPRESSRSVLAADLDPLVHGRAYASYYHACSTLLHCT